MHKILFAFIAAFSKWKKKKKKKSVIIPETFEFPRENVRRGAIFYLVREMDLFSFF